MIIGSNHFVGVVNWFFTAIIVDGSKCTSTCLFGPITVVIFDVRKVNKECLFSHYLQTGSILNWRALNAIMWHHKPLSPSLKLFLAKKSTLMQQRGCNVGCSIIELSQLAALGATEESEFHLKDFNQQLKFHGYGSLSSSHSDGIFALLQFCYHKKRRCYFPKTINRLIFCCPRVFYTIGNLQRSVRYY